MNYYRVRSFRNRRRSSGSKLRRFAMGAVVLAGLGLYGYADGRLAFLGPDSAQCAIKGNISQSGERIYHVPSGAFYEKTRISSSHGERWFCTETEARAAGWRRSLR